MARPCAAKRPVGIGSKYRYNVFKKERLKKICVVAAEEAAKRAKIEIIDMEVDTDHIPVMITL